MSSRSMTPCSAAVLHQLLLALDEFLGAVDAALIEDEIAYRGLHQHREVAARRDRNGDLADRHAEDLLKGGADLQAIELGELLVAVILEMHHQLEQLARAYRSLAEDGADVEHAD